MHFIPETVLRAVCWTLLHSLWQGLIFAVVAGVVLVLTRKASAALRYNLLCCGMILFLAVSGYTFFRQMEGVRNEGVAGTGETRVAAVRDAGAVMGGDGGSVLQGAGADMRSSAVRYFNTHASLVVLIWFMIFLARLVQLLSGWVYTQRIRHYQTRPAPEPWQDRLRQLVEKLGISRPVSLLESALVKVPAVMGMLKPVILVPVGMLVRLAPEQVESILLHELAHIRRRDYLFNLAQHVVDVLYFFNPALIWLSALIRAERENCCDDIAIRESRSRRKLIEALVSFHEYEQSARSYALGFAARENEVVRRVKRIVQKTNHSLNAGERVLLMGGLMVLSAAFVTMKGGREREEPKKMVVIGEEKKAETAAVPVAAVAEMAVVKHVPVVKMDRGHGVASWGEGVKLADTAAPKDTVVPDEDPFRNIPVDKLIECKDHGVTPEYINEFKKMGYKDITIDRAIELMDHGVSTGFIRLLNAEGYDHISLDRAQELIDHGVTVGFIRSLRQLGFQRVSLEKATQLVDHGVTIDFIDSWKKKIGKLLELDDYIKLRDAGISPRS